MKKTLLVGVIISLLLMVGCSSSQRYVANKQPESKEEYVHVIDHEKVARVSLANYYSPSAVRTIWVNPPQKRVKKSELEKSK
ncbi:hypothetical protein [Kangiella sp. TOML190]|uniref:hypothetical protein n=1 Tax=Kangiella sp. TOML190 TaxID=2931351 RepID=UPI002041779D|nr:hypothetical protein [Kangiella sp. TOML190]